MSKWKGRPLILLTSQLHRGNPCDDFCPCNATPGFCSRDRDQAWLTQPLLNCERVGWKAHVSRWPAEVTISKLLEEKSVVHTTSHLGGRFSS